MAQERVAASGVEAPTKLAGGPREVDLGGLDIVEPDAADRDMSPAIQGRLDGGPTDVAGHGVAVGGELVRVRTPVRRVDDADDYKKNADEYIAKLNVLDAYAKAQLATIPKDRRVLVTAHDAFNYFGRAYDLDVMGLQGISTASEASLRDVQRVVDELVKRKIKAVFVESSVPKRNIEAVVKGAKARGQDVRIGGELFSDAMGAEGTPEGTYDGMVRHNVDTIVGALK